MNRFLSLLVLSWVVSLFAGGCSVVAAAVPTPELVISTYDSLNSKHGLGPAIFPLFEKKCGCRVRVLTAGDAGQLVSRLQIDAERGKPTAQIVLGLDQNTFARARPWLDTESLPALRGWSSVVPEARVSVGFIPFDYGVFAFIADSESLRAAHLIVPHRLRDLLQPEWKRQVILEDPRTSTPGLAFLLYADQVGGEGFWARFKTQWLTLAPGWDGAYGLFLKKEAPLVWSYTTSQAYHEEHGDSVGRYQALVFDEGQPLQVEGAALVKGEFDASARKRAISFLEFLISPEVQAQVPLKNWMLPVVLGISLPKSFQHLPAPKKKVLTPTAAGEIDRALDRWKKQL